MLFRSHWKDPNKTVTELVPSSIEIDSGSKIGSMSFHKYIENRAEFLNKKTVEAEEVKTTSKDIESKEEKHKKFHSKLSDLNISFGDFTDLKHLFDEL